MALLDRTTDQVVLRIVYDGPVRAGKTTTVRALGELLGRPVATPPQPGERTAFFDWLDYTGGRFEGRSLRCQVLSVPGQEVLRNRRDYLISTADVVVFVAPLGPETLDRTIDELRRLASQLEAQPGPTPGIVLQANKRDLPGKLSTRDIRTALTAAGLRPLLVETVATARKGVREGFVVAVRLALDRVRELVREGWFEEGTPDIDSADALLARMQLEEDAPPAFGRVSIPTIAEAVESATPEPAAPSAPAPDPGPDSDPAPPPPGRAPDPKVGTPTHGAPPLLPDAATTPSGHIWPPIGGRLLMAEALDAAPTTAPHPKGWFASSSGMGSFQLGWMIFSPHGGRFASATEGRGSLLRLARLHAAHQSVLSRDRAVVLAPDHDEGWRLWQIVRRYPTLRSVLTSRLDADDGRVLAQMLVDVVEPLLALDERLERVSRRMLTPTVDNTGLIDGVPLFVGLFPSGEASGPPAPLDLGAVLAPAVLDWHRHRDALLAALARWRDRPGSSQAETARRLLEVLQERGIHHGRSRTDEA